MNQTNAKVVLALAERKTMEFCPTCQQILPAQRQHFVESLPEDYDGCQLRALGESTRTLPVMTEQDEE